MLVKGAPETNQTGEELSLQCRHYKRNGVSNHQPQGYLLNHLFKAQVKENIKAARHWPL